MIIFWLTCLVGYPRTSAPEPVFHCLNFAAVILYLQYQHPEPKPKAGVMALSMA